MPQPARALAGAACALVLSTTMFTPAAFADDAKGDGATTSRNAISAESLAPHFQRTTRRKRPSKPSKRPISPLPAFRACKI